MNKGFVSKFYLLFLNSDNVQRLVTTSEKDVVLLISTKTVTNLFIRFWNQNFECANSIFMILTPRNCISNIHFVFVLDKMSCFFVKLHIQKAKTWFIQAFLIILYFIIKINFLYVTKNLQSDCWESKIHPYSIQSNHIQSETYCTLNHC